MWKLLLSFVVVASSVPCDAAVYTDPNEVCQLAHAGEGAWFDELSTLRCLELDMETINLRDQIQNLTLQLDSYQREVLTHEDALRVKQNTIAIMRERDAESKAHIIALENEIKSWYRNPWVVGALGVIAGGAIVGVTAIVVSVN